MQGSCRSPARPAVIYKGSAVLDASPGVLSTLTKIHGPLDRNTRRARSRGHRTQQQTRTCNRNVMITTTRQHNQRPNAKLFPSTPPPFSAFAGQLLLQLDRIRRRSLLQQLERLVDARLASVRQLRSAHPQRICLLLCLFRREYRPGRLWRRLRLEGDLGVGTCSTSPPAPSNNSTQEQARNQHPPRTTKTTQACSLRQSVLRTAACAGNVH